ncbi:hypothetical protein BLS_006590 [Venturia inaequalis]|uniref:Uncharacterized protein n=1 Tax=Venturia inaequalis TaxID=5025 RepID=A0A8H3V7G7_VENIN|nr:hypothetical protein BLS_006590 [Venturia inaequalis]RDI78861.1 hypothetical protein Vi05172_g11186 [Venturia inaequalis]
MSTEHKLPQSLYRRLTCEEKRKIRPFTFLDLPKELRLEIYVHLLFIRSHDEPALNGRAFLESEEPFIPLESLHLELLDTCKTLREEGQHYLFTSNKFELEIVLSPRNWPSEFQVRFSDFFPDQMMYARHLTSLRIKMELSGPICSPWCFDWSGVSAFPNVKMLQLALVEDTCSRSGNPPRDSCLWRESAMVNHIVKGMVEHVPSHVEMKWGPWGLFQNDELEKEKYPMYGPIVIDGGLLKEIAQDYEHLRGRKVAMVVGESAEA